MWTIDCWLNRKNWLNSQTQVWVVGCEWRQKFQYWTSLIYVFTLSREPRVSLPKCNHNIIIVYYVLYEVGSRNHKNQLQCARNAPYTTDLMWGKVWKLFLSFAIFSSSFSPQSATTCCCSTSGMITKNTFQYFTRPRPHDDLHADDEIVSTIELCKIYILSRKIYEDSKFW